MALNNRTELQDLVAALAAVVDLAELKVVLSAMVESGEVKKPVSGTQTLSTASESIDFTGYDYVLATTTSSTSDVTITGIEAGEVKWLIVNNTALASWQFTGITNEIAFPSNVTTDTMSYYKAWNIDGAIHVSNLTNDITVSSNAAALIGAATSSLITPANLKYTVRSGHKVMSNAETYTVADGVGSIQVPSSVSGGTITLTDASAATSTGQLVEIYSTGGSGVNINLEGDNDTSVVSLKTVRYRSTGTYWTRVSNF